MGYQALYRTYRPKTFSEVIGQDHIVQTLINSVKQNKVGQAYLFSGPRGTGKTTVARLLARVINCESPDNGEPCGKCDRCLGSEGVTGVIEIDAASHGSVDDMRQLVAQVNQVPLSGGMMVYIIDEVHMLSKEAFNAFLKTLEEPPPHAVFVLATTEPGKLLPTIHSRCQHFAFHRLPVAMVAEHIRGLCGKENVPAEDGALRLIARAGDGSVRDSISVLEQAIAYQPEGLTLEGVRDVLGIPDRMNIRELGGHIISGDPGKVSPSFTAMVESGREPDSILKDLILHFRDLLFAVLELNVKDLEDLPDEEKNIIASQVDGLDMKIIHDTIAFLAKCEGDIKWEDEAALLVEVSLLRLAAKFGKLDKQTQPVETVAQAVQEPVPSGGKPVSVIPGTTKVTEPERIPGERPSLTGGKSLKTRRRRESSVASESTAPDKTSGADVSRTFTDSELLEIPEDIEPLWKNTLETIREISIADYILLAESKPSPSPSEWPDVKSQTAGTLQLAIKYPYNRGLLVKLLNEPALHNEITTRLEGVLERPIMLKIGRERGSGDDAADDSEANGQKKNNKIKSKSRSGPTLFKGAARAVPTDPELKRIHNLLIEEYPDYRFESEIGN